MTPAATTPHLHVPEPGRELCAICGKRIEFVEYTGTWEERRLMSTRSSVYYEDDGVHIFQDFMEPEVSLFLEYCEGPFVVTLPLSNELSDVILLGLRMRGERPANAAIPEVVVSPSKGDQGEGNTDE